MLFLFTTMVVLLLSTASNKIPNYCEELQYFVHGEEDLCALYEICMAAAINDINKLGYDGLANEIHSGPIGMIPDCNSHDDVLVSVGLFCAGYSGDPCEGLKTCTYISWPRNQKLRSEKKVRTVLLELQTLLLAHSVSHKHYQPTTLVGCAQNTTCGEKDVLACSAAFLDDVEERNEEGNEVEYSEENQEDNEVEHSEKNEVDEYTNDIHSIAR